MSGGGSSGGLAGGNSPSKMNGGAGGNISDDNETLQMVINDLRQEIRKKEESECQEAVEDAAASGFQCGG